MKAQRMKTRHGRGFSEADSPVPQGDAPAIAPFQDVDVNNVEAVNVWGPSAPTANANRHCRL
jgi:hypothetical protein